MKLLFPFKQVDIPRNAGIYFVYKEEELLYVGTTSNFSFRFTNTYINKFLNLKATIIFLIRMNDEDLFCSKRRFDLEKNCIKYLKPTLNVMSKSNI